MKYGYIITVGDNVCFKTPFKRTSVHTEQKDNYLYSKVEFDNGLVMENNEYADKIETYTNMQFITKDGVNYELCNEFDQNK